MDYCICNELHGHKLVYDKNITKVWVESAMHSTGGVIVIVQSKVSSSMPGGVISI